MSDAPRRPVRLGRRGFLIGGGAVLVAALGTGAATSGPKGELAREASRGHFDLRADSHPFMRRQTAHNGTVLQSFAFDDVNEHVYVAQTMQGGVTLWGESEPVSWERRDADGDMCLTKLDYRGGELGYMYLKGFGHGVSIGVEPDGDDAYIWTETDTNPGSGYGRAIARFKFADARTLTYGHDEFEVHRPVPGSTSNRPALDVGDSRLLLSYRGEDSSGESDTRYALYDLERFKAGDYEPVRDFPRPGVEPGEQFQGMALHRGFVYQMVGDAYSEPDGDNPPENKGNTYLISADVVTGQVVQRTPTRAAHSLPFREPQGLAMRLTDPPRLHMGFASGEPGRRDLTLYYKERLRGGRLDIHSAP